MQNVRLRPQQLIERVIIEDDIPAGFLGKAYGRLEMIQQSAGGDAVHRILAGRNADLQRDGGVSNGDRADKDLVQARREGLRAFIGERYPQKDIAVDPV